MFQERLKYKKVIFDRIILYLLQTRNFNMQKLPIKCVAMPLIDKETKKISCSIYYSNKKGSTNPDKCQTI